MSFRFLVLFVLSTVVDGEGVVGIVGILHNVAVSVVVIVAGSVVVAPLVTAFVVVVAVVVVGRVFEEVILECC